MTGVLRKQEAPQIFLQKLPKIILEKREGYCRVPTMVSLSNQTLDLFFVHCKNLLEIEYTFIILLFPW